MNLFAGTFYLYAGIATLGCIVLWLFLPETRGLGLEEVHELFTMSWFVFRHPRRPSKENCNAEVSSRK